MPRRPRPSKATDVSRVLRLPGTLNLPNEHKRATGRLPALARVHLGSTASHPISAFKRAPETVSAYSAGSKLNWESVHALDCEPRIEEWPNKAQLIATYASRGCTLEVLNSVLTELDPDHTPYAEWGAATFAFAASMKTTEHSAEEIAAFMWRMLVLWRRMPGVKPARVRREIERAISRSYETEETVQDCSDDAIAKMFGEAA